MTSDNGSDRAQPEDEHRFASNARRAAMEFYVGAKEDVIRAGFGWEIDWQERLTLESVTRDHVAREIAWVVLSSGMRASVVARVFDAVSRAFCYWDVTRIQADVGGCSARALHAFHHPGKIRAIATNCGIVAEEELDTFKAHLRMRGPPWLTRFGYVGPVTCWHLGKNLGLDVVKPDRHLVRMARAGGTRGPNELCALFAAISGDRLSVVDLVLWRFATIRQDYARELNALKQYGASMPEGPFDAGSDELFGGVASSGPWE